MQLIVAHHFYSEHSYPTFNLIHKIWTTIQQDIQYEGYTQYMPIWNNLQLPEVVRLENFDLWKKVGILLLCQLFDNEVLQPVDKLTERYHLPNKLLFQYLQLWHALQSQARTF